MDLIFDISSLKIQLVDEYNTYICVYSNHLLCSGLVRHGVNLTPEVEGLTFIFDQPDKHMAVFKFATEEHVINVYMPNGNNKVCVELYTIDSHGVRKGCLRQHRGKLHNVLPTLRDYIERSSINARVTCKELINNDK